MPDVTSYNVQIERVDGKIQITFDPSATPKLIGKQTFLAYHKESVNFPERGMTNLVIHALIPKDDSGVKSY